MKIGLGTVQFGMNYGISNVDGRTPVPEVKKILQVAEAHGMRVIDTAALYGDSEEVLGRTLSLNASFDLVSKTPRFSSDRIDDSDAEKLEKTFLESLSKLRRSAIYGLLVHQVECLFADGGSLLMDKMVELKQRGLVRRIGVSVYSGRQIDRVLDQYQIDLVQLPINVFDQRLLQSGHLRVLQQAGIEVHARSAFLQGLLLMDPRYLPPHLHSVAAQLGAFQLAAERSGLSPMQAALRFVVTLGEVSCVICGVNNHHQLLEICAAEQRDAQPEDWSRFALDDDEILDPTKWLG
jgi:aryl-alcohol dehydrogenase-like predicted oxidoreductase